jgi:Radical SAM superfamily
VLAAYLIALHLPMHTATRLAVALLPALREINSRAQLCFYGLYAPVNEAYLRRLGVQTIIGGEFEEGLASLVARMEDDRGANGTGARAESIAPQNEPVISLARLKFEMPDREGMPALDKYARLVMPGGEQRIAGATEASRGCKHLCRHCPIVPVYNGVFRIVDRDVVLADIRQQIAAGAEHITFGDPDFFNGIGHALPLVEALHREFPRLTYDVTIKIEHLLKHRDALGKLRETGCLFVTSAVESVDDAVLEKLAKHHTRADFLRVVEIFREERLTLQPTFVPFTPWTTLEGYCDLLRDLRAHGLIEHVAPIQLAIRLLIPAGSRLLELDDIRALVGPFDETGLAYPWKHADERVEQLCGAVQEIASAGEKAGRARTWIFERIEDAAYAAAGAGKPERPPKNPLEIVTAAATVPHMDEPWYCCAEPTGDQFLAMAQMGKASGQV